jgi:hypothetical protein
MSWGRRHAARTKPVGCKEGGRGREIDQEIDGGGKETNSDENSFRN